MLDSVQVIGKFVILFTICHFPLAPHYLPLVLGGHWAMKEQY